MKRRNPIAKAVTRIRPQVVPDKRNDIIKALSRKMFKDYGADCYEAFCKINPSGRIPSIERKIK